MTATTDKSEEEPLTTDSESVAAEPQTAPSSPTASPTSPISPTPPVSPTAAGDQAKPPASSAAAADGATENPASSPIPSSPTAATASEEPDKRSSGDSTAKDDKRASAKIDTEKPLPLPAGNGAVAANGDVEKAPAAAAAAAAASFPEFSAPQSWLVLLSGFLVMFCTLGVTCSFSVFEAYYFLALPWGGGAGGSASKSDIAWIGSLQLWGTFGIGLPAGAMLAKHGAVRVMTIGTILCVLGTMMASISHHFYAYVLSQGLCCAIGFGLIVNPALTIPHHWFLRYRGLAGSIVVGGSAAGGTIWPVILDKMLNHSSVGLPWTLRTVGFVQLVLLGLATVTLKERFPGHSLKSLIPDAIAAFKKNQAMLSGVMATFLQWFAIYLPYFYITPYALTRGVPYNQAFYYPSILNGVSLVTRLLAGLLADQYLGCINTLAGCALLTGVMLFTWPSTHSEASIILFTAFYGFFSGATISLMTPAIARVAGDNKEFIPLWVGFLSTLASPALLVSGPVGGKIVDDQNGDWSGMQYFGGAFMLVCFVFLCNARRNVHAGGWKA